MQERSSVRTGCRAQTGHPLPAHPPQLPKPASWNTGLPNRNYVSCRPQGTDPGTDFRGAGFVSLQCHLYMAARHPTLFDALRHKREGYRSQWEYPFAAAGVNLTFMLIGGPPLSRRTSTSRCGQSLCFLLALCAPNGIQHFT